MGTKEVKTYNDFSKKAKIINVHSDAITHFICTREVMKKFVDENKLNERIFIPKDGEVLNLD